jgi:hypothetical protein
MYPPASEAKGPSRIAFLCRIGRTLTLPLEEALSSLDGSLWGDFRFNADT